MNHGAKAYELLRKIPKGKVATYKELARALGNPKMARHVGTLMRCNNTDAPCYRVVKSDGSVGQYSGEGGVKGKIAKLEKDGIKVESGRIDLEKFGYKF
jgi:methylated-DNA-protein-cysteine methyltransferase related protein